MKRIFLVMASLNALALAAAFGLGLPHLLDRINGVLPAPYQPSGTVSVHFLVGLFTAVFTLLVHCLIFTYFLGTGRWVKEVARAYRLPDEQLPRRTREFKRLVFPPALFSMLAVIGASATGAAAQLAVWPWWLHFFAAVFTLVLNGWAFLVEYRMVAANADTLDQVMAEVERLRALSRTGAEAQRDETGIVPS